MTHTQLIQALYRIGAVKFGEFTLKSGQTSKIYLDLRQIISHPDILRAVADTIWQTIQTCKFDLICGVPYTALPIATCISLQHNIPMIMRRKEKKAYGTKQQIEGAFKSGQTCLIIEDLITTGSSILETADELEAVGLRVIDTALLIDRQQGGKANLEKRNFQVHAAFTLSTILQTLLDSQTLTKEEHAIIDTLINESI
ncbi:MAG: orotate phosphoribosyltransferase [Gammaproteobacteria bacterium]